MKEVAIIIHAPGQQPTSNTFCNIACSWPHSMFLGHNFEYALKMVNIRAVEWHRRPDSVDLMSFLIMSVIRNS